MKNVPVQYRLNVRLDAFVAAEELSEVRNILRLIHDKTAWYPPVTAGNYYLNGPDMDGIDTIRSETDGERVTFDCGSPKPETFPRIDAILGRLADIGLAVGAMLDVEQGNFTFYYFSGPPTAPNNGDRRNSPSEQYWTMNSMIPRNEEERAASMGRAMKIRRLARAIRNEYYGAYDVMDPKPEPPGWRGLSLLFANESETWTVTRMRKR